MATTVQLGRSVAITIASVNYDDQILNGVVTFQDANAQVETLNGTVDYTVDNEKGELTLEILQDWGVASGFCDALWDAADVSPNTTLAATVTINSKVVTLTVIPRRPQFGGGGTDALTTTVTLPVRSISKA
jgi:hypothetical protein